MYNQFFGFKEKPFKLVPNPEYLYLSRIHEEVLAHLAYAAGYGEGFVEITGEVGTGKTTLCRMFLERLDEKTEAAYIFNPKLDALQLLKAINDEFGIASDGDSVKTLIDRLNQFLLEKKVAHKKVLLLIDEAQNLGVDVLEQLRLLSNLETTTSKLLQIILVGQPELGELLESEKLRQLNQRISLSCQLVPLDRKETREYIRHRIHVASRKPGPAFTPGAHSAIFSYSGGIPRLINIACDRALLTAYVRGNRRITRAVVKTALRELNGAKRRPSRTTRLSWNQWMVGLLAFLVILILAMELGQTLPGWRISRFFTANGQSEADGEQMAAQPDPVPPPKGGALERTATPLPPLAATPAASGPVDRSVHTEPAAQTTPRNLMQLMDATDSLTLRRNALQAVLDLWSGTNASGLRTMNGVDDDTFFSISAQRHAMELLKLENDLELLRALNLPAVLAFFAPGSQQARFLALVAIEGENLMLTDSVDLVSVSPALLAEFWRGRAYIYWKNFFHYEGTIPTSSPGETIVSLKIHLKRLGFPVKAMNAAFDASAHRAVKTVQQRNGLPVDGVVGPMTKIVLYNEDRLLDIPRLTGGPRK